MEDDVSHSPLLPSSSSHFTLPPTLEDAEVSSPPVAQSQELLILGGPFCPERILPILVPTIPEQEAALQEPAHCHPWQ